MNAPSQRVADRLNHFTTDSAAWLLRTIVDDSIKMISAGATMEEIDFMLKQASKIAESTMEQYYTFREKEQVG